MGLERKHGRLHELLRQVLIKRQSLRQGRDHVQLVDLPPVLGRRMLASPGIAARSERVGEGCDHAIRSPHLLATNLGPRDHRARHPGLSGIKECAAASQLPLLESLLVPVERGAQPAQIKAGQVLLANPHGRKAGGDAEQRVCGVVVHLPPSGLDKPHQAVASFQDPPHTLGAVILFPDDFLGEPGQALVRVDDAAAEDLTRFLHGLTPQVRHEFEVGQPLVPPLDRLVHSLDLLRVEPEHPEDVVPQIAGAGPTAFAPGNFEALRVVGCRQRRHVVDPCLQLMPIRELIDLIGAQRRIAHRRLTERGARLVQPNGPHEHERAHHGDLAERVPAPEVTPYELERVHLLVLGDETPVPIAQRAAHVGIHAGGADEVDGLGGPHLVLNDLDVPEPRKQEGHTDPEEHQERNESAQHQNALLSRRFCPGRRVNNGQKRSAQTAVATAVTMGSPNAEASGHPNCSRPRTTDSVDRTWSTKMSQ